MSPAAPVEQAPTSTYAYRVPTGETPAGNQPEEPRRGGWVRWVVLLVLLSLAGLVTWRTITAKREEKAQAMRRQQAMANMATPVQVMAVQQRSIPVYLTGLGTITPYYSVKIIPRVTGELLRVNFREGQDVHKGEELMTIDARPYQATLDQARGQLARDQAQLQNNQAEFNRYKALYDQGVVSREQLDTYQSNLGQFQGAIKADEAAIESAQLNVTYCHIKSPIDGKVGLRQVDPGNLITANTTQALVVNQFRPIAVYFTLPEDQLQRVLGKLRADHHMDALAFDRSDTHQLESGQLTAADNQIDVTTGTDKLKAVFANQDEGLFPNQFVNVHLVLEQRNHAIVVPAAAVQHGTEGDFVWVVKPGATGARPSSEGTDASDAPSGSRQTRGSGQPATNTTAPGQRPQSGPTGTAEMAPVQIDTTEGSIVVLKSGVAPGDLVVVDGADKLQSGSKVVTSMAHRNDGGNQQSAQQQQLGPS